MYQTKSSRVEQAFDEDALKRIKQFYSHSSRGGFLEQAVGDCLEDRLQEQPTVRKKSTAPFDSVPHKVADGSYLY